MAPGPGRSGAPFPMKAVLSSNSLKSQPEKHFSNRPITPIIEVFRQAQQTGLQRDPETDVILVLADGNIPCHGSILSAVSPFFAKMFESQGVYYPEKEPREVIMPDFRIGIMKKVIQLVYNDEAAISSQKEYGKVREVMKILDIFQGDSSLVLNCEKGKITDKNEIIYADESSGSKIDDSDSEVEEEDIQPAEEIASPQKPPQKSPAKKSGGDKGRKTVAPEADKRGKKGKKDADFQPHASSSSDFSLSSSDSDDDDNNSSSRKRKSLRRGRPSNRQTNNVPQLKVVAEKLATPSSSSSSKATTATSNAETTTTKSAAASVPRPVMRTNNSLESTTAEQGESDLSSSDGEWSDSKCEDRKWFLSESSKCQKCKTQYSTAAKASECIAKHKVLRCYYCFHLCRTTDKLFEHFKKAHKQAGREDFLMCPFCEQSVPYKSVSCHVISLHMGPQDPKKLPTSRYVPKTTTNTVIKPDDSKVNPPPAKKHKIEEKVEEKEPSEFRVGNLEATISWTKENGKKRIFILKKNRGYAQ